MVLIKAKEIALAMAVIDDEEYFLVGSFADMQKLYDGGILERVWDIRLDNGHRPYPSLKKRLSYAGEEVPAKQVSGRLTAEIAAKTGLQFSDELHLVSQTYLFRKTASFWDELWADFSDDGGLPAGQNLADYHAVYRGVVLPGINNIKFTRL